MNPSYIILHTADSARSVTAAEIDDWHRKRNFRRRPEYMRRQPRQVLGHIGYHHFIRQNGTHELGRFEDEPGEHCAAGGMNRKSIGVCMDGDGDIQPWTPAQWETLKDVLRGIYARHPAIAAGGVASVIGHGQVPGAGKTCPGRLINMLDVLVWYERHVIAHHVSPIDPMPLEDLKT